jgi:hypothetical protein
MFSHRVLKVQLFRIFYSCPVFEPGFILHSARSTSKKQPYCNSTTLVGAWVRITKEKAEPNGSASPSKKNGSM